METSHEQQEVIPQPPSIKDELEALPEQKRIQAEDLAERLPDFRTLGRQQDGLATELGSSDADQIKKAIEAAQQKPLVQDTIQKQKQPIVYTIAGYRVSHPLPDDARIGWTAFSEAINPGGSLGIPATQGKKKSIIDNLFGQLYIDEDNNWQDVAVVIFIGVSVWCVVQWHISGLFLCCLLFVKTYFQISHARFTHRATDDIQRAFAQVDLASSDFERVQWLNDFVERFWLIFQPLLSAYVIENIDTYLVDYLPGFLDSVRLTTFTLGSKPVRIDHVKSFTDNEPNTVVRHPSFYLSENKKAENYSLSLFFFFSAWIGQFRLHPMIVKE